MISVTRLLCTWVDLSMREDNLHREGLRESRSGFGSLWRNWMTLRRPWYLFPWVEKVVNSCIGFFTELWQRSNKMMLEKDLSEIQSCVNLVVLEGCLWDVPNSCLPDGECPSKVGYALAWTQFFNLIFCYLAVTLLTDFQPNGGSWVWRYCS